MKIVKFYACDYAYTLYSKKIDLMKENPCEKEYSILFLEKSLFDYDGDTQRFKKRGKIYFHLLNAKLVGKANFSNGITQVIFECDSCKKIKKREMFESMGELKNKNKER